MALKRPRNKQKRMPMTPRPKPTHCPYGHEYIKQNLRLDKHGKMHCRACDKRPSRNLPAINGRLGLHLEFPARVTSVAMEFPRELEYDAWKQVLFVTSQVHNWSNWAIGDCINYGESHYCEVYAQAVSEAHISEDKAQICQYVSKRIDPITRRKELSWSHHREVAATGPDEQVAWLEMAYQKNLSVREMRAAMRGAAQLEDYKSEPDDDSELISCLNCGRSPAPIRICLDCVKLMGRSTK